MNDTTADTRGAGTAAIGPLARLRAAAWLLLDAVLFVVLVYKGIELGLLGLDGVVNRAVGLGLQLASFVFLLGFFVLSRARAGLVSRETLFDQVLGLVVVMGTPLVMVLAAVSKGYTSVWLPLEWHKIALNIQLMARIAPEGLAAGLVAVALLAWAFARRGLRSTVLGCALLLAWAALSLWFIVFELGSSKTDAYVIAFVLPLVAGALAGALGFARWTVRAAFGTALSSIILWIYVGFLPWERTPDPFTSEPGVTRIHPRRGGEPAFDLQYMREFVLSHDRRFLFTCYGPSSGLVRVDLTTGDVQVLEFPGLARYLWSSPERDQILSMDWDKGNFLVFRGDPLEVVRQVDILEQGRIAPWAFAVTDERIYVTFHELPILAEYERDTVAFVRQLSMRDEKLTRFRSGLLKVLYDPPTGYLYAQLGMTDRHDHFLLLKVDPKSLAVSEKAVLPEGGLDFITLPDHGTLVAASFFSDNFYEFTLSPLALKRSFEGPLNSRNVVFDPDRQLFYALAFLPGELWAFRYDTGEVVKRVSVGKKAQSLLLDCQDDALWVGSQEGIFHVDLGPWIGPRPGASLCADRGD